MQANRTIALAKAARTRLRAAAAIEWGGWGLAGGAGLALIGVIAQRLTGDGVQGPAWWQSWEWQLGISAFAGFVIGAMWAAARRVRLAHAAHAVDATLGLHDALRIGIELSDQGGVFNALAVDASERAAAKADYRVVANPVGMFRTGGWKVGAGIVCLGLVAGLWLPARGARRTEVRAESPLAVKELVSQAMSETRQALRDIPQQDDAIARSIQEVEAELGRVTPDGATRTRAADVVAKAAEHIERSAEEMRARADRARESLAQAAARAQAQRSDLARALTQGDLSAAANSVETLKEQLESMSPQERERVAGELERLASEMDRARLDRMAKDSADGRLGPARGESQGEPDRNEPKQDSGATPEAAARAIERPDTSARKEDEELKRLSDAARIAAEDIRTAPAESKPEGERGERHSESASQPGGDSQPGAKEPGKQNQAASKPEAASAEKKPGTKAEPREGDDKSNAAPESSRPASTPPAGQDKGAKSAPRNPADAGQERAGSRDGSRDESRQGSSERSARDERKGDSGAREGGSPEQATKPEQVAKKDGAEASENGGETPRTSSENAGGAAPKQATDGGSKKPGADTKTGGERRDAPSPTNSSSASATNKDLRADNKVVPKDGKTGRGEQTSKSDSTAPSQPKSGERDSKSPQQGREESVGQQGDSPENQKSDRQGEKPGEGNGKGDDGLTRMAEELRNMAAKSERSLRDEEKAAKLRAQSQKLLRDLTPDQRRELDELARRVGDSGRSDQGNVPHSQPGLGPFAPTPKINREAAALDSNGGERVDARGVHPGEAPERARVIAEWNSPPSGQGHGGVEATSMPREVERAARSAERAIEQQQVPAQYRDLVRRVFRRYVERANEQGAQPPVK